VDAISTVRDDGLPASAYGYVVGAEAIACTREELQARCMGDTPDRVWTPDAEGLVAPFDVPWIFAAVMKPARDKAREAVKVMGLAFGVWCLIAFALFASEGLEGLKAGPPLLLALVSILLVQAVMAKRETDALTPAALAGRIAEMRTLPPARAGRPWFTWTLTAAIGVVAVAQTVSPGSSFAAAGLVKGAVREGEWWRLLTAPLLHGGVVHLLMNGSALLAIGAAVERIAHRACLALVFLAAALAGGAASMVLYPNTTSVGASGGLMGVIGFLVVLAFRRRELLPKRLGMDLLKDVGWMAVLGIVGWAYIDNAAHAGGLLCGALLGLLLVPRGGETPHWEPAAIVRAAGWASLAVILAGAATAAVAMFSYVPA
jgi:membrane associated rhomboid family serine protease